MKDGIRRVKGRNKNFYMIDNSLDKFNLSLLEFRVYCCLMKYANADGTAFPGYGAMCVDTKLSKPAVIKAVKSLQEIGLIAVEKRRNKSNFYTIFDSDEVLEIQKEKSYPQEDDGEADPEMIKAIIADCKKVLKSDTPGV